MSAVNKTLVRNVGRGTVTLDGTDLGMIHVEGFKATPVGGSVKGHSSRSGTHVAELAWHEGQGCQFEFIVMQTEFDVLAKLFPGWTRVSGSGKEKLNMGVAPGTPLTSYTLKNVSAIAARTPDSDFIVNEAIFDSQPPMQFSGANGFYYLIKGEGLYPDTGVVASFGDQSATADATPPAVSAVVPADDASGQATSVVVTATVSKALNRDSLNAGNVRLYKDTGADLVEVPGAITGVNSGAATTIIFTPTNALSASSTFVFLLGNLNAPDDIYDQDGNRITHFASAFSTT